MWVQNALVKEEFEQAIRIGVLEVTRSEPSDDSTRASDLWTSNSTI